MLHNQTSILVGDERGQIKEIHPNHEKLENVLDPSTIGPFHIKTVLSSSLFCDTEKSPSIQYFQCHSLQDQNTLNKLFVVGLQTGKVAIIMIHNQDATITHYLNPESEITATSDNILAGLDSFSMNSEDKYIIELHIAILYRHGLFNYYRIPLSWSLTGNSTFVDPSFSIHLSTRKRCQYSHFTCMKVLWKNHSIEESVFAMSGSNIPLELWKWNAGQFVCIFSAKVPDSHINIRPTFIVNGIDFIIPHDQLTHKLPITVIGLSDKYIHVYDPRCNNDKAVFSKMASESSIQHVHYIPKAKLLLFSDTKGNMEGLDERASFKSLGKYHDFLGSVTQIIHYDNPINHKQQFIVTSCLDRFIRWHDVQKRTLIMKIYMVQRLTCLYLIHGTCCPQDSFDNENEKEEIDRLLSSLPTVKKVSTLFVEQ